MTINAPCITTRLNPATGKWTWQITRGGRVTDTGAGLDTHAEAMQQAIGVAQGKIA